MFKNKDMPRMVYFCGIFISIFAVLVIIIVRSSMSVGVSSDIDSDLQEIIKNVEMRQQNLLDCVQDATFMAKTIYRETDKDGNVKKDVVIERRIYMKSHDKRHEDYLSMIVNGKQLDKKEIKKESKDWQKKSRMSQTKMPLSKETKNDYEFKLIGNSIIGNMPIWLVEFTAKKKEDGYINGKAYVLKDKYDITRVDFTPAKIPSTLKSMAMSVIYSEVQGYWLPAKFEMNMDVDVKFVLNIYHRHVKVEDTYSQYKLNCGLLDSLFDG